MLTNKVQATEVQEPYKPLVVLENTFNYWWIVACSIVVGGLGGWFLYSLHPPIYEATAQFSIAIDYVSTGPITQHEEDVAVNTAGNIFWNERVLQQVVDQAVKEGIKINLTDLRKQILIERKISLWNLRVRDANPQVAERIATIWLNTGEAILQQGFQHAIQASLLNRYIQSLESCLQKVGRDEPVFAPCNGAHITEIQKNLQDANAARVQEKQASWNLFAGLMLGPFNSPNVSQHPVPFGRNQSIFLGSLLGLFFGVAVLELGASKFFGMKS